MPSKSKAALNDYPNLAECLKERDLEVKLWSQLHAELADALDDFLTDANPLSKSEFEKIEKVAYGIVTKSKAIS